MHAGDMSRLSGRLKRGRTCSKRRYISESSFFLVSHPNLSVGLIAFVARDAGLFLTLRHKDAHLSLRSSLSSINRIVNAAFLFIITQFLVLLSK